MRRGRGAHPCRSGFIREKIAAVLPIYRGGFFADQSAPTEDRGAISGYVGAHAPVGADSSAKRSPRFYRSIAVVSSRMNPLLQKTGGNQRIRWRARPCRSGLIREKIAAVLSIYRGGFFADESAPTEDPGAISGYVGAHASVGADSSAKRSPRSYRSIAVVSSRMNPLLQKTGGNQRICWRARPCRSGFIREKIAAVLPIYRGGFFADQSAPTEDRGQSADMLARTPL